ncbi:unnamed protein product, partial [Musa acuminata subsp. burmannicoides]
MLIFINRSNRVGDLTLDISYLLLTLSAQKTTKSLFKIYYLHLILHTLLSNLPTRVSDTRQHTNIYHHFIACMH